MDGWINVLEKRAISGPKFYLSYYLFRGFLGYLMGKECSRLAKTMTSLLYFNIYIYIYMR